jgi:hypothetical protein
MTHGGWPAVSRWKAPVTVVRGSRHGRAESQIAASTYELDMSSGSDVAALQREVCVLRRGMFPGHRGTDHSCPTAAAVHPSRAKEPDPC